MVDPYLHTRPCIVGKEKERKECKLETVGTWYYKSADPDSPGPQRRRRGSIATLNSISEVREDRACIAQQVHAETNKHSFGRDTMQKCKHPLYA